MREKQIGNELEKLCMNILFYFIIIIYNTKRFIIIYNIFTTNKTLKSIEFSRSTLDKLAERI